MSAASASLVALLAAVAFLVVSVRHLDVVPPVYEDEPWQASVAYKLVRTGVFGSDLFAGLHGMDLHYYGFMPLHPFLLAAFFRVLGPGLVQARLEPVLLSLLTLALTFALGRRLFGPWVGALALVWLVFARWTGLTYVQLTGVPLLDLARIARYDPLVPVFGLAALHLYLKARRAGSPGWHLAAGALSGLAGLTHLYGLFWLPVLVMLSVWDGSREVPIGATEVPGAEGVATSPRRRWHSAGWLILGGILPWIPYAAYVLTDLPDWRGQTLGYADRFDLLNPAWYLDNLRQEYHRYGPGLGHLGPSILLRIGWWGTLVALPVSLGFLAWRAVRRGDRSARAVVAPSLVLPLLFALLIHLKLVNYTLIELPVWAVAVGWGVVTAWRQCAPPRPISAAATLRPGRAAATALASTPGISRPGGPAAPVAAPAPTASRRPPAWPRLVLALATLAVVAEGLTRMADLDAAASAATPYPSFIQQVRATLPPGARVLGLHTYWFGLEDFDYRSLLVPLEWADPAVEAQPIPFDEGLTRVAPDVVLLDPRMRAYFASPEGRSDGSLFYRWLDRHDGRVIGRVDDATYGLMEIYRVSR